MKSDLKILSEDEFSTVVHENNDIFCSQFEPLLDLKRYRDLKLVRKPTGAKYLFGQ